VVVFVLGGRGGNVWRDAWQADVVVHRLHLLDSHDALLTR
jgi:hypothetical protein